MVRQPSSRNLDTSYERGVDEGRIDAASEVSPRTSAAGHRSIDALRLRCERGAAPNPWAQGWLDGFAAGLDEARRAGRRP